MLQSSRSGYTLIELLVVIVIMMILLGGSIAGFLKFSEQKTSLSKAQELQKFIRSAQVKARAKEWPAGCVTNPGAVKVPVIGYKVQSSVAGGVTTISMTGHCAHNRVALDSDLVTVNVTSFTLPSTLSLNSAINLDFLTLTGGVDLHAAGSSQTVLVVNTSRTACASFTVTTGGSISDATKVVCP